MIWKSLLYLFVGTKIVVKHTQNKPQIVVKHNKIGGFVPARKNLGKMSRQIFNWS